jgi:hypothetical protein
MTVARFARNVRLGSLMLLLGLTSVPALAQPAGSPPLSREELLRLLAERDAAIITLQNRMRALEQRLAAPAPGPAVAATPAVPAETPAAPPPSPAPAEPARMVVDVTAAERALERTLVAEGALLLAPGQVEIEPSLEYFRIESDTATLFLNEEGLAQAGDREVRRDLAQASLGLLFGLPFDSQLELDLPYRYVDQSNVLNAGGDERDSRRGSGSGLGDITVGLAKTISQEKDWRPDLIGRVRWDTGSGETADDDVFLGGGFQRLQADLVASKRFDPLVFVLQGGYSWNFEHDDVEPGNSVDLSQGVFLATSPETSLRFMLDQSFFDESEVDGERVRGSDAVQSTLEVGAALLLRRNILLDVSGTVGLTDESPDFGLRVAVPIRFGLPLL